MVRMMQAHILASSTNIRSVKWGTGQRQTNNERTWRTSTTPRQRSASSVRGDRLSAGRLPGGRDREPQSAELVDVVAGHHVLALMGVVIQRVPGVGDLGGPVRARCGAQ